MGTTPRHEIAAAALETIKQHPQYEPGTRLVIIIAGPQNPEDPDDMADTGIQHDGWSTADELDRHLRASGAWVRITGPAQPGQPWQQQPPRHATEQDAAGMGGEAPAGAGQ